MKRTELQDVTKVYVRPKKKCFPAVFLYEREEMKSVGELPMNFTKLR